MHTDSSGGWSARLPCTCALAVLQRGTKLAVQALPCHACMHDVHVPEPMTLLGLCENCHAVGVLRSDARGARPTKRRVCSLAAQACSYSASAYVMSFHPGYVAGYCSGSNCQLLEDRIIVKADERPFLAQFQAELGGGGTIRSPGQVISCQDGPMPPRGPASP